MSNPFESGDIQMRELKKISNRSDGIVSENCKYDAQGKYVFTNKIVFEDKKGNRFNFSELLPKGWKFFSGVEAKEISQDEKSSYFTIDYESKTVNYGKLNEDGRLFALFHELGHAINYDRGEENEKNYFSIFDSYIHNRKNQKMTEEDIRKRGEKLADYSIAEVLKPKNGKNQYIKVLVPKSIINQFAKAVAISERNASAFALDKIKTLRNKGIDIEINQTLKELRDKVYNILNYIEKSFEKEYNLKTDYLTKSKEFIKIENIEDEFFD